MGRMILRMPERRINALVSQGQCGSSNQEAGLLGAEFPSAAQGPRGRAVDFHPSREGMNPRDGIRIADDKGGVDCYPSPSE